MSKRKYEINRRRRTKECVLLAFGGKCGVCGYDKCQEALDVHHLDALQKEFAISSGIRITHCSWPKLVNELRKCVLLCCRCHREYHAGLITLPENIQRFDETYANYKEIEKHNHQSKFIDNCPICGGSKLAYGKTCSHRCAAKLKKTFVIDWGRYDLRNMFVIKRMSQLAISDVIGCSISAVSRRLLKEGLRTKQ